MGSYGGGVHRDLGVGLDTEVGIGLGGGRGMSTWLDAVASEGTPGNGEQKVMLCFTQSINRFQWESQLYPRTMLQDESR